MYILTLTINCIPGTPLIGACAFMWVLAISSATKQGSEQYAAAGGLASETFSSIRTVTALNAQPDVIMTYRRFLFDAMQIGIKKGTYEKLQVP